MFPVDKARGGVVFCKQGPVSGPETEVNILKRSTHFVISILLVLCLAAAPLWATAAVWGDVTGEGKISTEDARYALRAAIGLEKYEKGTPEFAGADIIADGKITTDDARLILRIAVGLEPAVNQYDILRTGTFYLEGDMDGNGSPMKMAVSKELVYLEAYTDGIAIGYLVKGKDVYLLSPADKVYHRITAADKALMKSADIEFMDETEVRSMVDEFGFDKMPPLDQADTVTGAKLDGTPCAVYTYNLSDGSKTCVYMYGYRLLAFSSVSADGKTVSMMKFTSVSADVPTLPPKGYQSVLLSVLIVKMVKRMG